MKCLWLAALLACTVAVAHADGGRLQVRQVAGPFVVSLFTTPEVLAIGPADVSVLVEERESGRVLLGADITVILMPQREDLAPIVAHLTHANATNRLLQAAQVSLPEAGVWHATIAVREANREATATTDLLVAHHSSRRGTVWLFAMLPVCAIGLFAWVQSGKRRGRRSLQRV